MFDNSAILVSEKNLTLKFTLLLGLSISAPLLGNQFITGSIVNATLFLAVSLLGIRSGIIVSIFPSIIALSTGILSPVMAPMIPFIITGNVLLVIAFYALKNGGFWVGALTAAIIKFIFLYFSSSVGINMIINQQVAEKISLTMSWPQLVTALIGSLIAFGFLTLKKNKVN
jgi:hypothetical protein